MTIKDIVSGLESLIEDRKSFLTGDDEPGNIFEYDIEVLRAAIERLKEMDTENPRLTLEELRERNSKPIWAKKFDGKDPGHWEICTYNMYDLALYGVTWLAYRRELEKVVM